MAENISIDYELDDLEQRLGNGKTFSLNLIYYNYVK